MFKAKIKSELGRKFGLVWVHNVTYQQVSWRIVTFVHQNEGVKKSSDESGKKDSGDESDAEESDEDDE